MQDAKTKKIIVAHFYNPMILQICLTIEGEFTVLNLRQYIIKMYNLKNVETDFIELWIQPNPNRTAISHKDDDKLLCQYENLSKDKYSITFIYWFNRMDFINTFQKWVPWVNIKQFAKQYKYNIDNQIAISFKDILRTHKTVDFNTKCKIPSINGLFDCKLFTLTDIYKKMIQFIDDQTIRTKYYRQPIFQHSEEIQNALFRLSFDNKDIVIQDNFDRSLYEILFPDKNDKNNNKQEDVIDVEIYWLERSVFIDKFYDISKLQFDVIQQHLMYDVERQYIFISILLPSRNSITRHELGGLFELNDNLTVETIKKCIDETCAWSDKYRIYYVVRSNDDVVLIEEDNNNDLISNYMVNTDNFNKLQIECMNQNRIFYHLHQIHQNDSKYDEIYANIDKTVLGNKTYFKLEVYNIKTTQSCSSEIYRGRIEMIDNMRVETIREHIICSLYSKKQRDELDLETSVLFYNGKILKDDDLITNIKKIENDKYWRLDILFIFKDFYRKIIVPHSYLACIRYSQYILTSIICNNILNIWPDDLSVIISIYLYGDKEWPLNITLKEECTIPPDESFIYNKMTKERNIEIFPYQTLSQFKTKICELLQRNSYSFCIRLCENNENIDLKTLYEIGLYHDKIESYFSAKKRMDVANNDDDDDDDEHLVYFSRNYFVRYKNIEYKAYYITINCFLLDSIDDIKKKIAQRTKIDIDKIRFRAINGDPIETNQEMKQHIEKSSRLDQY